jgi:Helix-turn-helix domain
MTSLPALDPRLLDDDAWRHAGQRVRERRMGLSLSEEAAARRAELDVEIWQRVEQGGGRLCRRRRVEAVCTALGWAPDAIERIVTGEEPTVVGSRRAQAPPRVLRPLTTRDAQHARVVCPARVGILGAVLIETGVVLYTLHAL